MARVFFIVLLARVVVFIFLRNINCPILDAAREVPVLSGCIFFNKCAYPASTNFSLH